MIGEDVNGNDDEDGDYENDDDGDDDALSKHDIIVWAAEGRKGRIQAGLKGCQLEVGAWLKGPLIYIVIFWELQLPIVSSLGLFVCLRHDE